MSYRVTIHLLLGLSTVLLACGDKNTNGTSESSRGGVEETADPLAAAHLKRAEMKLGQGLLADASEELEQALELVPDLTRAVFLAGRIAFLRADYPRAIEHLSRARELSAADPAPNLEVLYLLAEACLQNRKYERAEEAYTEILEHDERYEDAAKRLSLLYVQIDNIERALPALDRALKLFPNDLEILLQLGILLRDRHRIDESLALLRRAAEVAPLSAKVHYETALTLRRSDAALAPAREALQRAVELDPIHDGALYQLLQIARLEQETDQAALLERYNEAHVVAERETNLRNALEYSPERPDLLFAMAVIETQHRRLEDAERIFARVLLIQPSHREAATNLGRARMRLGRFVEAVAPFRRALELEPDVILNSLELAEALQHAGDLEGSIPLIRAAEALTVTGSPVSQPLRDDQHWLMLGQLFERANLSSDAERAFSETLERLPESGDALAGRGIVRSRAGDPAGAEDLRSALRFGTKRSAEAQAILVQVPR